MSDATPELTWFEIQVCPFEFRFAVMPRQPILIGFGGDDGQTALVRREASEELFDDIVAALDGLVRQHDIFDTPMRRPEQAFDDDAMAKPSLHLRAAYGDENRWASMYPLSKVPANVSTLLEACRRLGREVIEANASTEIAPETARSMVNPDVVARVKVTRKGAIFLDGRRASLDDFRRTCDRLHEEGGAVLYYREDPESEPHAIATQVIQAVIDSRLPIMLSEKDFDEPGSEDGEFVYPE